MRTWTALALPALVLAVPAVPAQAAAIPIEGHVLDDQGKGLAGADVTLLPVLSAAEQKGLSLQRKLAPAPADRATSDTDGRFRLAAPAIGAWRVRIEARGFAPVETSLLPLLSHRELEPVRLERDAPAHVQVLDAEGRPLPKALVWATGYVSGRGWLSIHRWYPAWRWAETDARGSVTLSRRAAERMEISVLAPGHPLANASLEQERAAVEVKVVPGGCERRIEVREASDRPAAGVVLSSPLFTFPESAGWEIGTTGPDGGITVQLPCRGSLGVTIEAADGRRLKAHLEPLAPGKPRPPQVFTLPTATAWTGRVLAAESREPITGALVWSGYVPWEAARSDARGEFVLRLLPSRSLDAPVSATLSAVAAGYLPSGVRVSGTADGGTTLLLTPASSLEGVVVDAADRPVAEAKVSADNWRARPRYWTRSDAAGRFFLEVPPTERFRDTYFVQAVSNGFALSTLEIAALEPGATRSGLRLVLQVGRQVFGRVVGPDQKPVGGAELALKASRGPSGEEASSDSAGSFRFPHVAAGRFDLEVKAAGFARLTRRGVVVPEGEGATDLGTVVLDPGVTLEGLVVDSNGRPIAGAAVETGDAGDWKLAFPSSRPSDEALRTGPDGGFRIENLERERTIDLAVRHDGYSPVLLRRILPPAAEPLRIVLQASAKVRGRVVDDQGEPVPGAEVKATAAVQTSSYPRALGTTRSGEDGVFQLEVEPGQVLLSARADGFLPSELLRLDVREGRESEKAVLQIRRGAIVEGRVTGPDGKPLAGAEVGRAEAPGPYPPTPFPRSSTETDADGRYRLEGVPAGPTTLEVEHQRFARAVRELDVEPGVNHLDVQMPAGVALSGRVMDAEGRPVEGVKVMLSPELKEVASGPDGGFRFSAVPPGTYSLGAIKTGYASAQLEDIAVQDAPVHGLELRFAQGSAIKGKILGLTAEQLAGVFIMAFDQARRGFASGQVDAGRAEYRIDGVTPGEWTLNVAGSEGLVRRTVTVPPDGMDVVFDLDLGKPEGLTLSGRIVRAGQPVAGASVIATGEDLDALGVGASDATGSFKIAGLAPGRYRLTLMQFETDLGHSESIEMKGSREIVIDLPTAKVSGRVELPDGAPAAGAAVELRPAQAREETMARAREAATDSDGAFVLGDAAPGSYRITANREGYARAESFVEVPASGDVAGVRLRLEPAAGLVVQLRSRRAPRSVFAALLDAAGRPVAVSREVPAESGRIHLRSAPAGSFFLMLTSPGFATVEVAVTVPSDVVAIDLVPGTNLRLTVPELARQGKRGALTITRADGRPFRSLSWFGEPVQQWTAVQAGIFRLEGLPAGAWTLRVTAPDGQVWGRELTTSEAVAGEIEVVVGE